MPDEVRDALEHIARQRSSTASAVAREFIERGLSEHAAERAPEDPAALLSVRRQGPVPPIAELGEEEAVQFVIEDLEDAIERIVRCSADAVFLAALQAYDLRPVELAPALLDRIFQRCLPALYELPFHNHYSAVVQTLGKDHLPMIEQELQAIASDVGVRLLDDERDEPPSAPRARLSDRGTLVQHDGQLSVLAQGFGVRPPCRVRLEVAGVETDGLVARRYAGSTAVVIAPGGDLSTPGLAPAEDALASGDTVILPVRSRAPLRGRVHRVARASATVRIAVPPAPGPELLSAGAPVLRSGELVGIARGLMWERIEARTWEVEIIRVTRELLS